MSDDTLAARTSTSAGTAPAGTAPDGPAPRTGPGRSGLRLSARDLMNVAIFAVIYFVVVYAVAMLGVISPLVMLLTLPLAIVVAGIPYLLFLTRVKHPGVVTLFGVVVGLLYLVMGQPWISTLLTVVVSVLADLVLRAGRYRSRWAAIWAYTVFSIWFAGPLLPLLMNRAEYLASPGMAAMGQDYVDSFDQVFTVGALWAYNGATVVCGVLGGLLGTLLLKKHFTRAGLA
ncbi:MAG TPA: MptD family putative ECF transporter S component [Cellulomonas sp.]